MVNNSTNITKKNNYKNCISHLNPLNTKTTATYEEFEDTKER